MYYCSTIYLDAIENLDMDLSILNVLHVLFYFVIMCLFFALHGLSTIILLCAGYLPAIGASC